MDERLIDGKKRYHQGVNDEETKNFCDFCLLIEKEIFQNSAIRPFDIDEKSIKKSYQKKIDSLNSI
jgi:hypothetical protein